MQCGHKSGLHIRQKSAIVVKRMDRSATLLDKVREAGVTITLVVRIC